LSRDVTKNARDVGGEAAQRRDVLARDADRDRDADRRPNFQQLDVDARAGDLRAERVLQRLDEVNRVVLVVHLHQDLRVVELRLLRRRLG